MLGGCVGAALRDAKANCCGRAMAGIVGPATLMCLPAQRPSAPKFGVVPQCADEAKHFGRNRHVDVEIITMVQISTLLSITGHFF